MRKFVLIKLLCFDCLGRYKPVYPTCLWVHPHSQNRCANFFSFRASRFDVLFLLYKYSYFNMRSSAFFTWALVALASFVYAAPTPTNMNILRTRIDDLLESASEEEKRQLSSLLGGGLGGGATPAAGMCSPFSLFFFIKRISSYDFNTVDANPLSSLLGGGAGGTSSGVGATVGGGIDGAEGALENLTGAGGDAGGLGGILKREPQDADPLSSLLGGGAGGKSSGLGATVGGGFDDAEGALENLGGAGSAGALLGGGL